jgi:hypothetical protein
MTFQSVRLDTKYRALLCLRQLITGFSIAHHPKILSCVPGFTNFFRVIGNEEEHGVIIDAEQY